MSTYERRWGATERRRRRSSDRTVALRFQLESARHTGNLEALVLTDFAGIVVAEAGDPLVCAELGAMAPVMQSTFGRPPASPLLRGADVTVRTLRCFGQELFLAAAGGGVARDALLAASARGIARILSAN